MTKYSVDLNQKRSSISGLHFEKPPQLLRPQLKDIAAQNRHHERQNANNISFLSDILFGIPRTG